MQTFYSSDQPTTSSEDPNPDLMNTQDLQEYLEKNPSFEIPASPKVDIPSDLDNKHEQTLDDFCSISNCDKDYARTLLEVSDLNKIFTQSFVLIELSYLYYSLLDGILKQPFLYF